MSTAPHRGEVHLVTQKHSRSSVTDSFFPAFLLSQGFDEYMNLVLDDAVEIVEKNGEKTSTHLGRILLKGDNITMLAAAPR